MPTFKKTETAQTNELMMQFKILEKQEQTKTKPSRWQETISILTICVFFENVASSASNDTIKAKKNYMKLSSNRECKWNKIFF